VNTGVLAAAFLFNLGQGVLRPALPLFLQQSFAATYTMVTLIPVVFGAGKWVASLPAGWWLDRLGRKPIMVAGLALIAVGDLACAMPVLYSVFLGLRALTGIGWAMFATAATTIMVDSPAAQGRARSVSRLLLSETLGLLVGTTAGGWLYQHLGGTSPFVFEAICMSIGAVAVVGWTGPAVSSPVRSAPHPGSRALATVLRTPAVLWMSLTNAVLAATQVGILVFLYPLYLSNRAALEAQEVGLLVGLVALGRFLALWLGGGLSDRWGRLRVLVPSLLAYAVLLGVVTLLTQRFALACWGLATGVAAGMVAPVPVAVLGDRVAPSLRGPAIGWLRTMTDSGHIIGALTMGVLADVVNLSAPFLTGAVLLAMMGWQCRRNLGGARG
jgi:MFS family permease